MLKLALRSLLVATAALFALTLSSPSPASAATLTVDDDGADCVDGGAPDYASLHTAVDNAAAGDIIRVCEGEYTETSMMINTNMIITGPGDTPEADGQAIIHHGGGFTTLFDVNAGSVQVSGLVLDLTPSGIGLTSGFEISGAGAHIYRNEMYNGGVGGISVSGGAPPAGVELEYNNIHDCGDGIVVSSCDACSVRFNTIDADSRGIDFAGTNYQISNNTVTAGVSPVRVIGDTLDVQDNTITITDPDRAAIDVGTGTDIDVVRNTIDGGGGGLGIRAYVASGVTEGLEVLIALNHFNNLRRGILLEDGDKSDAYHLVALIGGGPEDANVFRNSGATVGDGNYLLDNDAADAVVAENNDWGLCYESEIAAEIYDSSDDPSLGAVDFIPFVSPPSELCSPPTATPTVWHRDRTATPKPPTATATAQATATVMSPPAATATPSNGAGPAIIPPITGSGDSGGSANGALLLVALAAASLLGTVVLRRLALRRS